MKTTAGDVASLVVTNPQGENSLTLPLMGDAYVIGRLPDLDVTLDSFRVSRRHASLNCDSTGRWTLRDMGSRNGTRVNGRQTNEWVLSHGDRIQIADYTLEYREPRDMRTSDIRLIDTGAAAITSMAQLTSDQPRLESGHVSLLTDLGRRLVDMPDHTARCQALCELMVRDDFRARYAMVLRMEQPKTDADEASHFVTSQHKRSALHERLAFARSIQAEANDEDPYVSRTVIDAMRKQGVPVLASNVAANDGGLELSLSPDSQELCIVACTISVETAPTDVLYAAFPVTCAGGEWLTLITLAGKQFQSSESHWHQQQEQLEKQKIEVELRGASELQARLLPTNPRVEGYDISLSVQPCKWVGGDYGDVVHLPDGRVLLIVADVSGHGLRASLVTMSLHSMVHAHAATASSLGDLMDRLNRYFVDSLPGPAFVTVVAVVLDPKTGAMEASNFGHPPLLIASNEGVRPMRHQVNMPMGIEVAEPVCFSDQLDIGEMLAFYTDGFTEAENANGDFLGIEGVGEYLANVTASAYAEAHEATGGAEATSEHIATLFELEIRRYTRGSEPTDDRSLMLVKRDA